MRKIIGTVLVLISCSLMYGKDNIKDLGLKDLKTGRYLKLGDIKGKTYIKVWASWCHYCTNSLRELDKLSSFKDLSYNVISLVVADGDSDLSEKDFKEYLKYDVGYNNIKVYKIKTKDINEILKVDAYPFNIFTNARKDIIKKESGVVKNYIINREMEKIK